MAALNAGNTPDKAPTPNENINDPITRTGDMFAFNRSKPALAAKFSTIFASILPNVTPNIPPISPRIPASIRNIITMSLLLKLEQQKSPKLF